MAGSIKPFVWKRRLVGERGGRPGRGWGRRMAGKLYRMEGIESLNWRIAAAASLPDLENPHRLAALPAEWGGYGSYAVGTVTSFVVDNRQRFDPWNTAYASADYRETLRRIEASRQRRTVVSGCGIRQWRMCRAGGLTGCGRRIRRWGHPAGGAGGFLIPGCGDAGGLRRRVRGECGLHLYRRRRDYRRRCRQRWPATTDWRIGTPMPGRVVAAVRQGACRQR